MVVASKAATPENEVWRFSHSRTSASVSGISCRLFSMLVALT